MYTVLVTHTHTRKSQIDKMKIEEHRLRKGWQLAKMEDEKEREQVGIFFAL